MDAPPTPKPVLTGFPLRVRQATFGPTRESMAELGNRAASGELRTWIAEQMALPPTLHREHYRQRVNPREPGHFLTPAAGMRPVCAAGSRWSRFAFNKADHGSEVCAVGLDQPLTRALTQALIC